MPVANDNPPGKMGQDSKAEKPNNGIIRRVKTRIGRSRKGVYSLHEQSQAYGDIAPALPPSPELQNKDDYYNVDPERTRNNGSAGLRKPSKRTSHQSEASRMGEGAKVNGDATYEPTNGYHNMESISDPEDFASLRQEACKMRVNNDNKYVRRGEEQTMENGDSAPENYSVPGENTPLHSGDYSVPGGNPVSPSENYSIPGNSSPETCERYSVPGCENDPPSGGGENFERQGAKPKVNYNKGKNGLRDSESMSSTKRQAIRVNQERRANAPRQNYLNVDLADTKDDNVDQTSDVPMSWMSSSDDDIREALKGPVLPPLILPPTSPGPSNNVPKTPHIEIVFRKDDLIDEEFEFATRAVGFKIEETAATPIVSGTTSNREGMGITPRRISREGEEDPSEAGLLLMSQAEVAQHHEEAAASVGNMENLLAEDVYGASSALAMEPGASPPPPSIDRTNKPVVDRTSKPPLNNMDDIEENASEAGVDPPPPIPPRIPTKEGDDEGEPTHEAILHFKPRPKSLSLPRGTPSGLYEQQDQESTTNEKVVPRRRVISSFFHKRTTNKRHSTFSERPLPAIPPLQPGRLSISRQRSATMGTDRRLPQPPEPTPPPVAPSLTPPPIPPPPPQLPGERGEEDEPEEQPPPPPPKVPIKSPREIAEVQQILRARGEFASSLRKISDFGWYWGPMSWDDAEARLENTPDGSFLVRDSSDERHILSLSFRANGTTHHTRIEHQHGKFSFWSQPTSHGSTSVVDFIEEAMKHSHNGSFLYFLRPRMPGLPPAPVQLLYAISRFQKARSLQHMCRFVIRKNIRLDHIDQLPLPKRLRAYIAEAHYYTPEALEA